MGGRVSPYFLFWTSISENSMAGAAADTGTRPDSAPQMPLKTLVVSPVAAISVNTVSGVPTMLSSARFAKKWSAPKPS